MLSILVMGWLKGLYLVLVVLDKIPTVITVDSEAIKKIVSCGHSWSEQEIIIVNPDSLQECLENEVDEILVSGGSIIQGYWNQPELTQKTFEATLRGKGDKKILRTEDLGFLNNGDM